jgi:hypothetical protein
MLQSRKNQICSNSTGFLIYILTFFYRHFVFLLLKNLIQQVNFDPDHTKTFQNNNISKLLVIFGFRKNLLKLKRIIIKQITLVMSRLS